MTDDLIAGRYQIDSTIGSGAMGDVYRATDTRSGQAVAVKSLKADLVRREPGMLERFKREGQLLRDLNHPNIVTLLDVIERQDAHYLIMGYVPGGDLAGLIAAHPDGLPLDRAMSIGLELADALTRAHHLGIVHRDIKPANVLLAEDGAPRLTDFGIAHLAGHDSTSGEGLVLGTYSYLSPEACMGEPLDGRADIWAFGLVLYEMLTGQKLYDGIAPGAIITAILNAPLPDFQAAYPDIPDGVADLLYRMLEKSRDARIPSIRLVGAEIEAMVKGIEVTPGRVSAVFAAGEASTFATPTPSEGKHNLPAQAIPFVGRETEMEELAGLIGDPHKRLVTLLAPGGMGKTRLAIEAGLQQARSFRNGVLFVPLDKLEEPERIPDAIAEAAGHQFSNSGTPHAQILHYLANKHLLLILDNFEHIVEGAELVSEIVGAAPEVTVLATSRQRLDISAENVMVIPGMEFPAWETPADALRYSAVQLFMQSATRVRLDFQLTGDNLDYVARICRLVQGVPLGILLAAAWVDTLTVEEIAEEIQASVDFLESRQRDLPERQRSMRAVFDYSWRLLSPDERAAFARMSVFRGGCTRRAAATVSGVGVRMLTGLVNKSLLWRDQEMARFRIHELLRQFAEEELDTLGEAEAIRDAHAAYYLEALAARQPDVEGRDQIAALDDIEIDFENVRAAWMRALLQRQDDLLLNASQCVNLYCHMRTRYLDGADLFRVVRDGRPAGNLLRARAVAYLELFTRLFEKRPAAVEHITAALEVLRGAGDPAGEGLALLAQGYALLDAGDFQQALAVFHEALALFEQTGDRHNQAVALHRIGFAHARLRDDQNSNDFTFRSLAIFRELGNLNGIAVTNNNIATYLDNSGQRADGLPFHEENVEISRRLGNKQTLAWSGAELAVALAVLGQPKRGRQQIDEALDILDEINHTETTFWVTLAHAIICCFEDDFERMNASLERIDEAALARRDMRAGIYIWRFRAEVERGDFEAARRALRAIAYPLSDVTRDADLLGNLAFVLERDGRHEQAAEILHAAFSALDIGDVLVALPMMQRLRARLEAALPADLYAAAEARGRDCDREILVQQAREEEWV